MNVGEVCNREVVIISKGDSIIDAAKMMRQYNVGDLIVVEETQGGRVPVGILTDRDIVIEIIAEEVELDKITVGDSMSYELLVAYEQDEVFETMRRMSRKGVRRLPVINIDGGLEGIITVDNIIDLLAEQLADLASLVVKQQKFESHKLVNV